MNDTPTTATAIRVEDAPGLYDALASLYLVLSPSYASTIGHLRAAMDALDAGDVGSARAAIVSATAALVRAGESCNLYFPTDNTICDKPRGHDDGAHEAAALAPTSSPEDKEP